MEKIRTLFASILEPTPEEAKAAIPLKQVLLDNLLGLYFVVNSPELVEKAGIPKEILQAIPKDFDKLKGHSLEIISKGVSEQPDSFFKETQAHIEKGVSDFRFRLDQLKAIKVPKLGNSWTDFFQKVLNNYFPDLVLEDKKRILAFMIRNFKEGSTETEALLNSVYASGPYFQKYMQFMADKLEPGENVKLQELKKGLMSVKGKLPSIPQHDLDAYLKKLRAQGVDLEIIRSLGAASVGEVFLAKNKSTGQQIVVKFIRPRIRQIAERERQFFKNQASLPALKRSFEQIAEQIDEELDYKTELKKLEAGIKAYSGDGYQINVVKPVHNFPNGKDYFAMELVDGQTFHKLGNDPSDKNHQRDKIVKSLLWEKLIQKFLQQALFANENAFFHGDLHEGNIMVIFDPKLDLGPDPDAERIKMAIQDGLIKLVLIDFGNAHTLTQDERRRLKNIFLAAATPADSSKAFLLAMFPEGYPQELKDRLDQTVFTPKNAWLDPPEKIGKAMDVILDSGFEIPGFLMAFKRSIGMLHNTYLTLDRQHIDSITSIFENAYIGNWKDILQDPSEAGHENRWSLWNRNLVERRSEDFEENKTKSLWPPLEKVRKKIRGPSVPVFRWLKGMFQNEYKEHVPPANHPADGINMWQ
ncbi:MAG: AarF/UbiB family protein [Myxococcaceae bacterium]